MVALAEEKMHTDYFGIRSLAIVPFWPSPSEMLIKLSVGAEGAADEV